MNTQNDLHLSEEAADWVLRRMEDDTPECNAAFLKWLRSSPGHIDEFLMTANTIALLGGNRPAALDIQTLLQEAPSNVVTLAPAERAAAASVAASGFTRTRLSVRRLSWAAGIAAAVFGAAVLWIHLSGEIFSTDIGEQRTVRLDDGSLVQLNTRTRVRIRFSEHARELRLLAGEAYFTAAPDTQRPFRVIVNDTPVQAVSTEFNIYRRPEGSVLSVLEGRVRVGGDDNRDAVFDAGEQASITSNGETVRKPAPDVGAAVAWLNRRLIFRGAPLAEVAAQFNRYNKDQISIAGEELGQQPIWGVFRVDEPQALVKFLEGEPSITLQKVRGGVVVRRR